MNYFAAAARHLLWPAHEFQATEHLAEHLVPATRMRNRWHLDRLLPYIRRWLVVAALFGGLACFGSEMPHGMLGFLVYAAGVGGMATSIFMAGFWCWLYSLRPR